MTDGARGNKLKKRWTPCSKVNRYPETNVITTVSASTLSLSGPSNESSSA
jgi:hypothetical protein